MAYSADRKFPPGYDSEAEFIQEARERFQMALDFDRENRDQGLEDLKFFAGEQWEPEALSRRSGRPCLTINRLPQFVAQVVGDIRINRPAIKVRPAEDADKDLADIREGLIRAIERDSDAQGVYSSTGQSQVACGIGNFRITLKYATDNGFDRDIGIEAIPNPFAVVWDPLSTERTGRDASYCFVVDEVPRKAFERAYKDQTPSELEIPLHDTEGWYTKDTVRVTEYWLIKETPVELALLEGGQVVEMDKVPEGAVPVQKRKSTKRTACMYLITGKAVLDGPFEFPIDRVPIIRAQGWEVNQGDKRVRFGLVRFAKDPSRLQNYWRSVSAEMLALAPKARWLLHESNEGDQDAFRNAHASDDAILTWGGAVKPEFIAPPTINQAVLQEASINAQDMKDVTGLHDASLGARSNETSGKAIMARQREGDVSSYIYHDNLQAAIKEGGRVVNMLIPVTYDTARTIRIVGEDETTKVKRVNDPADPDSVDLRRGRYDVVIETGPSYSTKRVESAESMMQFVQAVPTAAQVAGDLIAKAQDWPLAEEIGERLKRTLPPNITESADEEKTPEEQQAAQMAMQQAQMQQEMQMQGVQLQMAEAAAKVKLTEAQAMKAMAEAQSAGQGQEPQGPSQLDQAIQFEQLRKAKADADKAEAEAQRASIAVEADIANLRMKPIEAASAEVDLVKKMQPDQPETV